MQHTPFRHPLATHPAGAVLGWRRNGAPIYAIAGGSDEDDAGSDSGAPAADPAGAPPATPPAPADPPKPDSEGVDWKAMARQWEKRAKENAKAQAELEKLRKAAMSEQERAVAEAEEKGRQAAAAEYGARLAAAEFRAAVAAAGLDLGDAADLIDVTRFVGEDGEVDTKAIQAAVKKLAKLAPAKGPGRSGADIGGGSGDAPDSIDKQIADAQAKRDWSAVIRLKRQKAAQAH